MVSLTAGSPKCHCKNPDTCIHSFTLTVKERSFTYRQSGFVGAVDTIDESSTGVPVSLSLVGKTCVSGNPKCPQGMIYSENKSSTLMSFNNGTMNYTAHYNPDAGNTLDSFEGITFLNKYVLTKDPMKNMVPTPYILRVGQCQGGDFVNRPLNFMDGVQILNMAPADSLWTLVNVYPAFSWATDLTVEISESTKKYSEAERRKIQKAKNVSADKAQRGARGWTTLPEHEITRELDIEGSLSYKFNGVDHPYSTALLKKEYKKNPDKLSVLNKAQASITKLNELFAGTQSQGGTVKLITTEIIYPKLKLSGGGELRENEASDSMYMEYKVSLGMDPLIGMRLTFDLIQAFAAWYKTDILVAAVREQLMSGKQAVEEGKNAAFAGMKLNLIAEAEVDLGLQFTSDADGLWQWQAMGSSEVKGTLILDVHVQAGVRYYVVNGALDIKASAKAELMLGLDDSRKDQVDMVFYHNGITAEVHVSFTASISLNKGALVNNKNTIDNITDDSNINKLKTIGKNWIIYDKLDKKKSKHQIHIL